MKKLLTSWIIVLLVSTNCFAGQVSYSMPDGTVPVVTFDDKYSFKDFGQKNLLDAEDLEGKIIYYSSFAQETPDTKVFPDNVKNMTFYNCDLDNVFMVKPGWVVIGGSERRYKVQNDLKDWELSADNKPIKVLNEEDWIKRGFSVDSKDIPLTKIKEIEDGPKAVTAVIE